MKSIKQVFAALFFLFFVLAAKSQATGANYFAGKWNMLVKGTPGGDSKMVFVLEKKDSTITGSVLDSTGNEMAKMDKVELNGTTATVYFSAKGYDVNVVMNKIDEDHVNGSLLGMFQTEGERVKAKLN